MKSWKTTLCGAFAALGLYLESQPDPAWLPIVGKILAMIGAVGTGLFAKDFNVTTTPPPA